MNVNIYKMERCRLADIYVGQLAGSVGMMGVVES